MTYMEALEVLGLNCHSCPSKDEIKAAYRKLCRVYHPDAGGSHDDFVRLQQAYAVAQNPPEQTQSTYQQSNYRNGKEWTWIEDWFEIHCPKRDDTLTGIYLMAGLVLGILAICWVILQPGMFWEIQRVLSVFQGPVVISLGLALLGYIISKAFLNAIE